MLIVSQDGQGDFTSIQAAVDSLPEAADGGDREILIKKGTYRERVAVWKDGVRLVGEDAAETVLTWSASAQQIHPDGTERSTFRSWTLMVNADDITVENLTVRNDAGDGRKVGQAVAVYAAGDRGVWRGCRLIAHQDTLYCGPLRDPDVTADLGFRRGALPAFERVQDGPLPQRRQYFEDCYLEGDVDFIFGSHRCWFERCALFMGARGGWYTAANTHPDQPWGFVFHNCRLTGDCETGAAFLGRPWRAGAATCFLTCEMDAHVAPEGFADWDATRVVTGRLGEWRTSGARADQRTRHPSQKRLTDAEAARITIPEVLGGWDPSRGGGARKNP